MQFEEYEVKGVSESAIPWHDRILIAPFGDTHLDAKESSAEAFKRDFERCMEYHIKTGAPTYFLGMGDYVDIMSPSNRTNLKAIRLYDSVHEALEERAERTIEDFTSIVKGSEGMWLGALEGHHFYEFADGSTSDTRIAQALGAPFLGDCGIVRLKFRDNGGVTRGEHTIWCHHGAGGGIMPHSGLQKLYHLVTAFDADTFFIGHQHKMSTVPLDQVYISRRLPYRARHRVFQLGCTGSYLQAYQLNSKRDGRPGGSYVEKWMLRPSKIGHLKMWMECINDGDGRRIERTMEV